MKKVVCVDRHRKEYEVPAEELKFRPAVYGVIMKDGKILLSKQWDGYDFPGGGVDLGEDVKDALRREVKEETGLDVAVGKIVTCENSFYKPLADEKRNAGAYHSLLIYYLCDVVGGELSTEFLDQSEKNYLSMPEWISIEETKNIKFYNTIDSLEIIEKALEVQFPKEQNDPAL